MSASTYAVLHDYITLPIIISDWDAIDANKRRASEAAAGHVIPEASLPAPTTETPYKARRGSRQRWATGFSDYVDSVWKNMSDGMKQKLREACVEVLRRTDGASDDETFEQLDNDARFLD